MVSSGASPGEVVFTMRLDPADFKRFFGAGAGGGMAGGPGAPPEGGTPKPVEVSPSPTFMSIFRPLAVLELIKRGIDAAEANSSVANTYLSSLGKVYGAAIDMLLTPFLPLFNLIMVAVTKLIWWLMESGAFQAITSAVDKATQYLEGIGGWIQQIAGDIKNLSPGGVAKDIGQAAKGTIGAMATSPLGLAALLGTVAVGGKAATMAPGLGGLLGAVGGSKGLFPGLGAAAGSALTGLGIASAGLTATSIAGGAAKHFGAPSGLVNVLQGIGSGASLGAGAGALSFTPFGIAAGAIGGGLIGGGAALARQLGLFGLGGGGSAATSAAAGGGGGGMVNSGNVINVNQTITGGGAQAGQQAVDEIQRQTGFKLATRG